MGSPLGMIGAAGARPPNAWGLYDTCGLVWEWAHADAACSVSDRGVPICGGGWLDPRRRVPRHHRRAPQPARALL